MKRILRFAALTAVLSLALLLMPASQPACEGGVCTTFTSYMSGSCLVTEVHNSCLNCTDYWWECPWGDWEDVTCY